MQLALFAFEHVQAVLEPPDHELQVLDPLFELLDFLEGAFRTDLVAQIRTELLLIKVRSLWQDVFSVVTGGRARVAACLGLT